jgi:hypothetical protein
VVVLDPSAFDHVHETLAPPVSSETLTAPQPDAVTPDGGAAHDTVTSDVCHAKQLDGPGEQVGSGGAGGGAAAAEPGSVSAIMAEIAASSRSSPARPVMPASYADLRALP